MDNYVPLQSTALPTELSKDLISIVPNDDIYSSCEYVNNSLPLNRLNVSWKSPLSEGELQDIFKKLSSNRNILHQGCKSHAPDCTSS